MDKIEAKFEVTEKLYTEWCKHPVSKNAKKTFTVNMIFQSLAMLIAIALGVVSIIVKDTIFIIVGFILALIFCYRAFFRIHFVSKKYYKKTRSAQNTDKWIRDYIFTDKILVKDANQATELAYSDITNVTEDEEYIYLAKGEAMVFRIPKNSFIMGNALDLKARFN